MVIEHTLVKKAQLGFPLGYFRHDLICKMLHYFDALVYVPSAKIICELMHPDFLTLLDVVRDFRCRAYYCAQCSRIRSFLYANVVEVCCTF